VGCASGPDLLGFTGLEHAVRMKETDWATLSKMEKRLDKAARPGTVLCGETRIGEEKKRGSGPAGNFGPRILEGKENPF
jgi:hypothetical protein